MDDSVVPLFYGKFDHTQVFVFYMAMPFSISAGKLPAEMQGETWIKVWVLSNTITNQNILKFPDKWRWQTAVVV